METTPEKEHRQWQGSAPNEKTQALIEEFAALELGDQLKVLRSVLPSVTGSLSDEERSELVRDLGLQQ